jgi:hypothetical protein
MHVTARRRLPKSRGHRPESRVRPSLPKAPRATALFSWAELINSPLGSGLVVAYDIDGARPPANAGSFALLARHDLATGPRHVRGLRSVEVHKLWQAACEVDYFAATASITA